ncbi:sulfate ABC transporter permease subunit CysT [Granulibacter bethesdensis]|uniref:Sulfate transport system permease protein CysT n=1 Tax=Granulibacter bethesdensis (strain ATCC BAA-1260 / CGDNIH1) TaxID=391165 RepID=Q0BQV7_GRABC|nr:sulfate ABC transporter permease subunit CysT [Granulibacter bethesdensis]ABI62795.1 Sulfate transport system permease protein cysT [Granulibacter bethesdensis CGDNIH1]APH65348.1 Sulfate transport system permease protein cysT [Granulibacter bethesdensis]
MSHPESLTIPDPVRPGLSLSRTIFRFPDNHVLPGFWLSFGVTMGWVSSLVLLPLLALFAKASSAGMGQMLHAVLAPRALAALELSFGVAAIAALINLPLGLLLAWVLVRIPFPGRSVADAIVDLPFALPTAVAGITLATLYGPSGWIGAPLASIGIQIAFTRLGIVLALIFIGLPFVVRSVAPVLADFPAEQEEAATTLGASPWQSFRRVMLPALLPALLSGFGLAFARGVGEYGSVIFISSNIPMVSEIAPTLIVSELQEFHYASAACIGLVMLAGSALSLVLVAALQRHWASPASRKHRLVAGGQK